MSRGTGDEVSRQLRQHLDQLAAMGIHWLPRPDPNAAPIVEWTSLVESPAEATPNQSERRRQLTVLTDEVKACTACGELASSRTQTVFGVGPLDPDLCFVGEAPGADEDRQGEPFVGAAGQLLDKIIIASGLKRSEIYICNVLRCRPPGNRPPKPDEATNCRPFLERTLEMVRPKFICCLGTHAAQNLLQTTVSIGHLRGRFHEYRGIPVLCTYHPSFLLRSESIEPRKKVWDDMKMLLTKMGRLIPEQKKRGDESA